MSLYISDAKFSLLCIIIVFICINSVGCTMTSLENTLFMINSSNVFETSKRRLLDRWEVPTQLKIGFMGKQPPCMHLSQGYLNTHDTRTLAFREAGMGRLSIDINQRYITLKCLYMTNINYHVRKKWKPRVREVGE